MGIPVKLDVFDGPLDLLLHLIEKNKIDIFDIPIVEITEQYMDIISQMENKDMDIMSEFLVMASRKGSNTSSSARFLALTASSSFS